ncbi:hypothetical protein L6R50_11500 [Myxococcota bacterium]|nr:hypothetical protein [Myxococcota bacterium]
MRALAPLVALALALVPAVADAGSEAEADGLRLVLGGREVDVPLRRGEAMEIAVADPAGGPDLTISLSWTSRGDDEESGDSQDPEDAPPEEGVTDAVVYRSLGIGPGDGCAAVPRGRGGAAALAGAVAAAGLAARRRPFPRR